MFRKSLQMEPPRGLMNPLQRQTASPACPTPAWKPSPAALYTRCRRDPAINPLVPQGNYSLRIVVVFPSVTRALTHAKGAPPWVGTTRTSYSPGFSKSP